MLKCNKCIHNQVCKYKSELEEKEQQITKIFTEESSEIFNNIEINCKYFADTTFNYWPEGVKTLPTITSPNTANPCTTCWFTKKLADGGIYVGDSPCEWCQHSPLRVTCGPDPSATTSPTSTGTSTKNIITETSKF